ncbi:MAG: hypothetical protein M1832_000065 [Thelocarpon impressellum]|nr:MAG: hypothetical protein M1832_000065 [Thelocarpon impressellum]
MLLLITLALLLVAVAVVEAQPVDEARALFSRQDRTAALIDCLLSAQVPTKWQADGDFAELSEAYNLRLKYTPAAIALPNTPEEVSRAVGCAASSGIKVQARSGGHGYAAFALGGQDGSLVVDLRAFQEITLNQTTNVAKVGTGVRLGNMAQKIFYQGGRALPHGTCPGVGVGGHFTHGGFGFSSRNWGLALDTVVGLDVVLANGTFVHTDTTTYPEIYYALRGAADSFGIVTTFYLQTNPAPASVVSYSFSFSRLLDSKEAAAEAFMNVQKFVQNASVVDRRFHLQVSVEAYNYRLLGVFWGSVDEFRTKIAPELLRNLPQPDEGQTKIEAHDWIRNLNEIAYAPLTQPTQNYDEHDAFLAKSIVTQESKPLTRAAMESYFGYVISEGRNTPAAWFAQISLHGGPDSQVNIKGSDFSAYAHRSALWVFQNYGRSPTNGLPFSPAIIPFVTGLNDAVLRAQPDGDMEAYLNYVDPTLSTKDAHRLYYGERLYERLLALKQTVDPASVFWNPQAIGAEESG